jgi:nucleoid-associated protein YgaU
VSTVAPHEDTAATAEPTGGQEQRRSSSARGPSPTASAAPGSDRRGAPDAKRGSDRAGRTARDGGQLVADEAAAGSARERTSSRREAEPPDTYRVRPGDSLWRIAERRLGSSATPTETAEEVTRLWELNRQRIGTGNPDLILPGQTLTM